MFYGVGCVSGEGNGNPLQCSCLENPRDGVAWWAARRLWGRTVRHDGSDLAAAAMGLDAVILVFLIFSFKPVLSFSSFTLIRGSLVPLRFLPLEWYHPHI